MTLPADMNHPGPQEDVVSGWQPAQCLVGSMVPGAAVAICLSPLAVLHLSLCLQGEPQTAALLCYLWGCDPLFCECPSGHGAALEPSRGKGPFFFICSSGVPTVWGSPFCLCCVTLVPSLSPHGVQPRSFPQGPTVQHAPLHPAPLTVVLQAWELLLGW